MMKLRNMKKIKKKKKKKKKRKKEACLNLLQNEQMVITTIL